MFQIICIKSQLGIDVLTENYRYYVYYLIIEINCNIYINVFFIELKLELMYLGIILVSVV